MSGPLKKTLDPRKQKPDWIAIEGLYRAGIKSVNSIAKSYRVPESTIRNRAKKLGWVQDAAGTKRQMVSDLMSGSANCVAKETIRNIKFAAEEDARDMNLGLEGARAILQSAVDSIGLQGIHETENGRVELKIDPKDLKTLSECIRINVETIRTIRELDPPEGKEEGSSSLNLQALNITDLQTLQILLMKAADA